MKGNRKTYNTVQRISAIFMIVALLWLTISTPFVFASQQHLAKQEKSNKATAPVSDNEEETTNPFGNSTEEKSPTTSTNSVSEEYLHDHCTLDYFFTIALQYHKCENAGTYTAYHGELLVPPPNVA